MFRRFVGPTSNSLLDFVAGVTLLLGMSWLSFNLFQARDLGSQSREVTTIQISPAPIRISASFSVKIVTKLSKLCPYELRWSFVRRSDNVEVLRVVEPVRQPPAALGDHEIDIVRSVPDLAPGAYFYASEVYDICPNHTYTTLRKSIPVTVVP